VHVIKKNINACLQVTEVLQHPNDKVEAKYNTDAGVSKEDEDRYHSLLAENDDLQKLIAAVSCLIIS